MTPESIASQWNKVVDFSTGATNPESNQEMMEIIMTNLEKVKEEAASAPVAAPSSGLISESIFSMMKYISPEVKESTSSQRLSLFLALTSPKRRVLNQAFLMKLISKTDKEMSTRENLRTLMLYSP